ncbi:hypothetical protein [Candidatus Binatus sp.]|jgi:hypothetical protein|uniref:hypothetical protein n=1 Tax=Candidatus Binatus sp. TaxID=2811406 RepID=UPI002FDA7D84
MDPEAAAVVNPHLLAREEILWCGRPHDTSALRWRAGAIILVGIAALVMRSIPLDSSLAERADTNSILLAMLVGVLIAEAIVFHSYMSKTFYGVTNQRVIIVSGLREPQMVAVLLDRLNAPQLRIRRIYHDIELRAPSDRIYQLRYLPFANPSVPPDWIGWPECYRLIALEDARRVCDLIVESAHKLK